MRPTTSIQQHNKPPKNVTTKLTQKQNHAKKKPMNNKKHTTKKLALYILRWQLSSPILALTVLYMTGTTTTKIITANLIGALIFFPIDKK